MNITSCADYCVSSLLQNSGNLTLLIKSSGLFENRCVNVCSDFFNSLINECLSTKKGLFDCSNEYEKLRINYYSLYDQAAKSCPNYNATDHPAFVFASIGCITVFSLIAFIHLSIRHALLVKSLLNRTDIPDSSKSTIKNIESLFVRSICLSSLVGLSFGFIVPYSLYKFGYLK